MKIFLILPVLALAILTSSCGHFSKSEEAIKLTIDTDSVLKGRLIDAKIKIQNGEDAEKLKK